jgi:arabinofuranosyltransferase
MAYRWRALLSILLIAILAWASHRFHPDDALIYARYIRNALHGQGLVFNPGERVNALTSPLHSCLLLVASWMLGGRVLLAQWLLGVLFLSATALLGEWFVPYSGILIGGMLYFEIFLEMETPLFMFLLLLSSVLYVTRRWTWLPLALCLTALARFEGGALILPVAWQMYRRRSWPKAWTFLPPIVLLVLYAAVNLHLYGKWLPSSGAAKIQQGLSGYWGRWPTAFLRLPYAFWHPLRSFAYVVPLALWLGWRGSRTQAFARWNPVVLPFLGILLAFYVLLNVPGYLWYYAPFVLFTLIYAAQGMPRSRWAFAGLALVVAHATILGSYLLVRVPAMYDQYRSIAAWINANAAPGASVAAAETGTIGWYAPDHPVIDIVGLTTPRNAQLMARHDLASWLIEEKPDYVIVHSPSGFGEAVAVHSADYEPAGAGKNSVYLLRRIPGH